MSDPLSNLKQSLDQLLQADTSIKRKNKKIYDQKKELFINLINQFENSITRSYLMEKDFKVDLSKYEYFHFIFMIDIIQTEQKIH